MHWILKNIAQLALTKWMPTMTSWCQNCHVSIMISALWMNRFSHRAIWTQSSLEQTKVTVTMALDTRQEKNEGNVVQTEHMITKTWAPTPVLNVHDWWSIHWMFFWRNYHWQKKVELLCLICLQNNLSEPCPSANSRSVNIYIRGFSFERNCVLCWWESEILK